mmetsp:Transcript_27831/g.55686  ORF Transcript_27831/g.55686 Transcript_27831/m.55686 type:complete len:262 (-) Transcript_27831:155-940(-)
MSTSSFDFLVEEEAQVVPSSLDHLSRHELCHMIYRLDYERHTLKEKLVALRLAVSASNVVIGAAGGGGRRSRAKQTPPQQLPLPEGDCPAKEKACSADDDDEEKVAKRQKTNNDDDEVLNFQTPEPTPQEMNAIHTRLAQTILSEIKSTTHGGLRKPRTTAAEKDISFTTAMYIMQHYGDKLTHDTKRMIKWEFKCHDDIAKYLQCKEKYLSGVRHNGRGFLVASSCLQYAKFELMVVSYDKLTMSMKIQVTTRGCTENGK